MGNMLNVFEAIARS